MNRKQRIAIYMRLSKGDHGGGESNSIRMQRELLREFAAAHFKAYELLEFEDDGYSGTNFNRPGVAWLLEMVRNMEVDCILVKDFSRFSRDYIELGAYIEQIFPFMGVRFISVNDGYDSADTRYLAGQLDISFKNLLYDLYSKDLSVKVKSALRVRKEKGQYVSPASPFGYVKSREDRHMLQIDETEAEIVRRIFALALQGHSSTDIARLFNREGVKTPMQLRAERGEAGRAPKKGIFLWQSSTVCQILRNRAYVGDFVYGKTEKETVGGRNRPKPRSEWKVCENHHAPIIDRDVFEKLQERRGKTDGSDSGANQGTHSSEKKQAPEERHPLAGRLACGCCGRNLCLRKLPVPCFVCPYRHVNPQEGCVKKADAAYLEKYVLSEMQLHVLHMGGEENLKGRCRAIAGKKLEAWKKERRRLQREVSLLKRQKAEAYEAYSVKNRTRNGQPADNRTLAERAWAKEEALAEKAWAKEEALAEKAWAKEEALAEKTWVKEEVSTERAWAKEEALAEKAWAKEALTEKVLGMQDISGSVSDGSQVAGEPSMGREEPLKTGLAEIDKKITAIRNQIAEAEEKAAFYKQIMGTGRETADAAGNGGKNTEVINTNLMHCLGLARLTARNVSVLIDKIVVYGGGKTEIHWVEQEGDALFRQLCDTGGN